MEELICTIEQGALKGQNETDIRGVPFFSFSGIPYAKPPLGELRFKSPQPPENWEGVRDATTEGSPCHTLQLALTSEGLALKPMGSEDCLFLNVYTHNFRKNDQVELKPVMMFIHGGAFVTGSSTRAMYGPEFLMTEDIVLVTINYRLGPLGFLTIADPSLGVTGNAGLKDTVQALKWIQKNINRFGGDSDNVTIFGESAGGAAVHYLILSPLAKGLFHKAILQSGSVLCPWAHGVNNAQQLAQILGSSETDHRKILEFLQQVPVEKLVEGQIKLGDWLTPAEKRLVGPGVESKSENAFLFEDPIKIINSGNYNTVPMMFGYNSLEGIFEEGKKLMAFQWNLDEFVPYYFGYQKDSSVFQETNKKISKYYFGSDKPDPNNKEALYLVLTDTLFLRAIHLSVKAHAQTSPNPVYYYRMSVETTLNTFKNMINIKTKGVSHADDLGYLFKIGNPVLKPGSVEDISVCRFVKLWTNFARTGNPTPVNDSLLNAEWKPVTKKELNFLDIGTDLVPGINPDIDRMNFWDEICKGIKECY